VAVGEIGLRQPWHSARALAACLLALAATTVLAPAARGDDEAKRAAYEQAFGAKEKGARVSLLPLVLDGRRRADIRIAGADPDRARVETAALAAALGEEAVPELLERIRDLGAGDGFASFADLRAAGLTLEIDAATVALRAEIRPDLRPRKALSLAPSEPDPGSKGYARQADLSGYLNSRLGFDWAHKAGRGEASGRQPVVLGFDGVANLHGTFLETELTFTEGAIRPWSRGDVRLVHDDEASAIRYSGGDVVYPATGFQSLLPMAGFAAARDYAMRPYQVTRPSGQGEMLLGNDARVEVWVNGRRDRVLELPAGRYGIRDFGLRQGANDVELRIVDSVGRSETISLPFFASPDLLAEGMLDFGAAAGFARSFEPNGERRYEPSPVGSSFLRYGLAPWLTAGANLQGDTDGQLLGLDLAYTAPVGAFRLEAAGSRAGAVDGAVRAGYFYADYGRPGEGILGGSKTFAAQIGWTGRDFAPPGSGGSRNDVAFDVGARTTLALPLAMTLAGSAAWQFGREERRDTSSQTLGLRRSLASGLSVGADVTRSSDADGVIDWRGFLSISFQLGGRIFAQGSHDSRSERSELALQYSPPLEAGLPSVSAVAARDPDGIHLSGIGAYAGNRFDAMVLHDESLMQRDGMDETRRTGLRLGTAIALADGHVGSGRPIDDGFALVTAHPALEGRKIGVEPSADGYRAETGRLGPAVLSGLGAHQGRRIEVAIPDAAPGEDIGDGSFYVKASRRRGTVLEVGSAGTLLADGILVDDAGTPVAMRAGEVRHADGAERARPFFTNGKGRFRIDGLRPGRHLLFVEGAREAASFAIEKQPAGIVKVGSVVVRLDPAEEEG
jgi:outer membrane usher protein